MAEGPGDHNTHKDHKYLNQMHGCAMTSSSEDQE